MKAVVLTKKGKAQDALQIQEVETPTPKDGEVRIKVESFGLNFADVMARLGLYNDAPPLPTVVGYEVVGTIDEVGQGVDEAIKGKRVVAFTRFGGYAQYATTPVEACSEIGDMDAGKAAAIAVQYATAYYMSWDAINLFPGDKVMIHAGAGGVGTALIQLCKLKGCEIFANAGSDEKLAYMKEQGADHVINYRKQDYQEEIKKELKGEKLQATFNPIAGKTYKKDKDLIGAGGRIMLFGASDRVGGGMFATLKMVWSMGFLMPITLVMSSKTISGVNMLRIADQHPATLKRCMDEVVKLVNQGKLDPQVGARFKADEVQQAHELLESRRSTGKIIVSW